MFFWVGLIKLPADAQSILTREYLSRSEESAAAEELNIRKIKDLNYELIRQSKRNNLDNVRQLIQAQDLTMQNLQSNWLLKCSRKSRNAEHRCKSDNGAAV